MPQVIISGIVVDIVRKAIKNLHLGVYPPYGRVRVAAPLIIDDEAIRLAVICKLGWIKRQQAKFEAQPRQSQRKMVSGESHYFLGQRYRLKLIEYKGVNKVILRNKTIIELHVNPNTSAEFKEQVLERWYRTQLKKTIALLLEKWQPMIGVRVALCGIKKMKTKWGSCNPISGRIWINLELAKAPSRCLEYIVVHELVHLLERHHNNRFSAYMDQLMPDWHLRRDELNNSHLGHHNWICF